MTRSVDVKRTSQHDTDTTLGTTQQARHDTSERHGAIRTRPLFLWELSCASFRHSAGFQARVVLDRDAFRPGVHGEVADVLCVLGVDHVVPVVLRVLVSW